MAGPSVDFWQERFRQGMLHWDRGAPHPQLAQWLADGVLARGDEVLVPGCGAGHEVVALAAAGLRATGLDYTPEACALAQQALDGAGLGEPRARVLQADVRHWQPEAPVAAVYEQTCLCALHPDDWQAYARQLQAWLRPGGRLCALLMQCRTEGAAEGRIEGPPYHLDIHAVRALFPDSRWAWPRPPYPLILHPRRGGELAVVLVRK